MSLVACSRLDGLSGGTDTDAGTAADAAPDAAPDADADAATDAGSDASPATDAGGGITLRGSGPGTSNPTSVALSVPADAVAGDLVWVAIVTQPSTPISTPAGLSLVDQGEDLCSPAHGSFFMGPVTTPGQSFQFQVQADRVYAAELFDFAGVDAKVRAHGLTTVSTAQPWKAPSVSAGTSDVPGSALLWFAAGSMTSFGKPPGTTPLASTSQLSLFALPVGSAGSITPPASTASGPCGFAGVALFKNL
jgi:hypothetical protein